jgi:polyhydroxybutyrate depolymerase
MTARWFAVRYVLVALLLACGRMDPPPPPAPAPAASGGSGGGTGSVGESPLPDAAMVPAPPVSPPDAAAPPPDAAAPAVAPTASEGCGKDAPKEGVHDLMVGGTNRRFFLRVPATYDGKKPWPVVFAYHGAGKKSASWFDTNTDLRPQLQDKAVLVFPEGPAKPDGLLSWVFMSDANVVFTDVMITWLKANLCIDPSHLFATGQSSGGYMALTLGCARGDVFRAVGTSSGGFFDLPAACTGTPDMFIRTGKADTASTRDTVIKARDFFLEHKKCSKEPPTAVAPAPCVSYGGCEGGARVIYCEDGGAHDWPSFATKGMWDLFTR